MSTLAEIESAADSLPADQKEALLQFLAARLREQDPGESTANPQGHADARVEGKASEWVRVARGSVRMLEGETAGGLQAEYYAAKYGMK